MDCVCLRQIFFKGEKTLILHAEARLVVVLSVVGGVF